MATKPKVLSYNDIALRLNRINAQIHTGLFDAPLYGAEKEKQDTLIAQRDALQKQLEASTPKGQYTEDQIASAMTQIEKLTNQRSVLISQGAKSSDPALQQLGQQFQDQQAILDQAKKDQATIDKLKSDADSYIKDQNVQLNAKEKAASQAELDQTQLSNLQEKQAINKAFGQTDPSIDAQIAALKEKTAQIPAGTNAGPNAVVANNQKIATTKPSVTPPVDSAAATAATIAAAIAKANGGNYTTSKGILSLNDNPYSGEYKGKYYTNGKLETTAQIKADFLTKYGEQAKFIASVPELSNLLTTAISQRWAPTQWATQFANTQWAQAHPGDIGLAEIKRISAPSQYNTEYNAAQTRIQGLAANLGIKLTPQQIGVPVADITSTPKLDQTAVDSGQDMTNWLMQHPNATDSQIQQQMAKYGTIDPATGPGGTIKSFSNNLQNLAQQYGVLGQVSTDGSSKVFDDLAVKEAASGASLSDPAILAKYENQYRTQAMATYKPFADQIANGARVSDLASPYLNTYASLMEVSPSDIQLGALTGPGALVSKALIGDANGQVVNPYDFASQVRSQPGWLNTQNAHNTLNGAADYMIQKMGM
jgi:hypothetical protein